MSEATRDEAADVPGTRAGITDHEIDPVALGEALSRGRAAWPDVPLEPSRFAVALTRHRPDDVTFGAWLSTLRVEDLYVATACVLGEPAALRHLEARFFALIDGTVRRVDPSAAFVDEIRQELRLHMLVPSDGAPCRLGSYSGTGALAAWLNVAAARLALRAKRRRDGGLGELAREPATTETPEHAFVRELYRDELQAAFEEALTELTPRERNVLRMHFLDGTPLERIALIYGTHRTTLGRWVQQACSDVVARTRRRLGARAKLPPRAVESLVALLRSQVELSASLLLSERALLVDG